MNIAIVFFSYAGDAQLLQQSLRAIPHLRAYGDRIDVYLADDATGPIPDIPEHTHYISTTFNRCGNLNGLDCILGMARTYAHILSCTDYDWIIKTDCDTYINHLHWLRNLNPADCMFTGTTHAHDYPSGPCYAISAAGVRAVNSLLSDPVWQGKAMRGHCEDRVFFHLAKHSGHTLTIPHSQTPTPGALFHDWTTPSPLPLSDLIPPYAVDFKTCRWNSPPSTWQLHAATALTRLTAYANLKDSLFLPSIVK